MFDSVEIVHLLFFIYLSLLRKGECNTPRSVTLCGERFQAVLVRFAKKCILRLRSARQIKLFEKSTMNPQFHGDVRILHISPSYPQNKLSNNILTC